MSFTTYTPNSNTQRSTRPTVRVRANTTKGKQHSSMLLVASAVLAVASIVLYFSIDGVETAATGGARIASASEFPSLTLSSELEPVDVSPVSSTENLVRDNRTETEPTDASTDQAYADFLRANPVARELEAEASRAFKERSDLMKTATGNALESWLEPSASDKGAESAKRNALVFAMRNLMILDEFDRLLQDPRSSGITRSWLESQRLELMRLKVSNPKKYGDLTSSYCYQLDNSFLPEGKSLQAFLASPDRRAFIDSLPTSWIPGFDNAAMPSGTEVYLRNHVQLSIRYGMAFTRLNALLPATVTVSHGQDGR
jgi:hypothetical protein